MLYLSRKLGESIIINNTIEMQVVEIKGRSVKLGFVFPPEASVLRKEIYDKIREENMAAAGSSSDATLDDLLGAFGAFPSSAPKGDEGDG